VDARQALVVCATTNLPCAVRDERVVSRACLDQHLGLISIVAPVQGQALASLPI